MLVLSRKFNEQLLIGDDVTITVVEIRGGRVRLGIEAPRQVKVLRSELRKPNSAGSERLDGKEAVSIQRAAGEVT